MRKTLGDLIDMSEFNDQGERLIEIYLKDKTTGKIIGTKQMKRAAVAKAFQPLSNPKVIGSQHGKFILEF